MNVRSLSAAALLLCGAAAHAGDLSPEQVAKIQADEQEAQQKVSAAHGNRSPAEMDPDERKQMAAEQRKASQEVMEKNGVSAKDFARASATMSREERDRANAARDALKADAEKKAAAKTAAPASGPTIEYGIPKEDAPSATGTTSNKDVKQYTDRYRGKGTRSSGKSKRRNRGY